MATVIDALIVTLGLDAASYNKAQKEAKKKQGELNDQEKRISEERKRRSKDFEDQAKRMAQGFSKIRNEALALLAVFTAGRGIKDFINDTINNAAALGFLSKNLKMSTQDLTAWQRASERAGGSAEGITAQLKESAQQIAALNTGLGPSEGMQWFFRYGGNTDDLKDGNTYLLARARIVKQLFDQDPSKAALVSQSMGISEDQFNLIKQGPAAILALVEAQKKNASVTEKDAEQALKLRNRMLDLRDRLESVATKVILRLAPTLERLALRLQSLADWVADHQDDISRWVDGAVTAIREFVREADRFATAVGGWKNVLIGLAALKFASTISSLGSVAAAIAGIVTAGAGIPALVVAVGALAAYGGYKGAEYLFGKKDKTGAALRAQHNDILKGGTGKALGPIGKDALRAEAARQMGAVGGNAGSVVEKLKAMGWSSEQAAGIAGSFLQESGLNPSARNATSGAYGIGQWLGSRRTDFRAWAGKNIEGSTVDEQLAFFQYEVTQGKEQAAGARLRAARTAEDAARIHSEAYERPGTEEANIARRQAMAAQLASGSRRASALALATSPAGASYGARSGGAGASSSKSELNIGEINIHTQATDAQGIAQAMPAALGRYGYVVQANTGQN